MASLTQNDFRKKMPNYFGKYWHVLPKVLFIYISQFLEHNIHSQDYVVFIFYSRILGGEGVHIIVKVILSHCKELGIT